MRVARRMEEQITAFDWHRMLLGDAPPLFMLEIVFRAIVIYLFALVFLHLLGKRGRREITPLEYLVIIALGSATGDAMFYPEVPLLYAAVVIVAVLLVADGIAWLKVRLEPLEEYIDGAPILLVEDGRVLEANLRREKISEGELHGMLRERRVEDIADVRYAILESTGALSVFRAPDGGGGEPRSLVPPRRGGEAQRG